MPTPRTGFACLAAHLSDAELIGRYVADRDQAAFAALVARHGPAVLGVCRRTLGNLADADDAFQATFLVLARKAHRVAFRRDAAGWLFAVAVRCSRELLRRRTRRAGRETPTPVLPGVPAPASPDAEAGPAVLAEVARLSEAYRSAVVLCELEGRSRADAAARLGVPEGTLSSRLATARRLLARRLAARGLAPVVLAVPAATAARAVGLATASVVPSERVLELTEAVMRTGFTVKMKLLGTAAAVLLAAVGLAVGGDKPMTPTEPKPAEDTSRLVVRVLPTPVFTVPGKVPVGGVVPADKTMPVIPAALIQPADAPPVGSVIGVHRVAPDGRPDTAAVLHTPDRRAMLGHSIQMGPAVFPGSVIPVACDGRRIAYQTHRPLPLFDPTDAKFLREPLPLPADQFEPKATYLHPLDGGPAVRLPADLSVRCFSRDGRSAFGVRARPVPSWANAVAYSTVRLDTATGKEEPVALPADAVVQDTFPDGRFLVLVEHPHLIADSRQLAAVTPGRPPVVLTPKTLCGIAAARVSPDGAKVAHLVDDRTDGLMPDPKEAEYGLFVLDVATKTVTRLPHRFERGAFWHGVGLAWSPDGRRLAYSVNRPDAPGADITECGGRVVVCDADGRNVRAVRVGPPVPGVGIRPFVQILAWN